MPDLIVLSPEILRTASKYVTREIVDSRHLSTRLEACLASPDLKGYGIASVQIGEPYAFFVMVIKGEYRRVMNPMIIDKQEPIIFPGEGCLSLPGYWINTDRYDEITVSYEDYDTGRLTKGVMTGIEAIVYSHEYDHCAGILISDREHRAVVKTGRNEPCPCLSGRKYKHCCLGK